jgi:hypothetical protein
MSRGWLLTSFADELIESVGTGTLQLPEGVVYFAGQVEQCPNTGLLHVQAHVRLSTTRRMAWLKRAFNDAAMHCEPQRGTNEEATAYCTKEDTRMSGSLILGTPPRQGERSDLLLCRERLLAGQTLNQLFHDEATFTSAVRYHRGLSIAQQALQPLADRSSTTVEVLYGPPGTGKTSAVRQREPSLYIVDPPNRAGGSLWFDNYQGEPALLFDDYDGWCPYRLLLRILDRYPVQLPQKGSFAPCRATRIYLTSNVVPVRWHTDEDFAPLRRRIGRVWFCTPDAFTLELP